MSRDITTKAERKKYFKYVDEYIKNKSSILCITDDCKCIREDGLCAFYVYAYDYLNGLDGIHAVRCPVSARTIGKNRDEATEFFYDNFSKFLTSKESIE